MGKQTLGGHKQNLVCTRTQEKGEVTPQETDPDFPVSVQESQAEVWVSGGLLLQAYAIPKSAAGTRPYSTSPESIHLITGSLCL